jgi:hypothetical protein
MLSTLHYTENLNLKNTSKTTENKEKRKKRIAPFYGAASTVMAGDGKTTNSPLELPKPKRHPAFQEPLRYLPQKSPS